MPAAMGGAEWAMLLALSLLWGGSFFFVGVAVTALPVASIVALRVGLAAAVLWLVLAATGRRLPRERRVIAALAVMGVLNNVIPFGLIVWGQTSIGAGLASILNATTPLFGVVVAGLFLADERMSARRLAGVALGFAGVVVMIGPEALSGLGRAGWAQLAILGAALSYACAGTFGRRFAGWGVDPVVVATGQVTVSALMLAPAALLLDRPWTLPAPGAGVLAAVLALAVLSTALAYVLYFRVLARAGATNILLVTFLVPVSAILLGVAFLGEALAPAHVAGMVLIGAGLAAIDGRLLRRR
ncbi:EamA family transporter [Rhodobacteraceae bacterium 2CG4]|uniref:EamA family transporter n=2 Tax=Halovulum marinum TaxID=2662447 RepID=A0A6L5Z4V8_9RHOB|nr:EamA family transporter [Halovulum marinum]